MAQKVATCQTTLPGEEVIVRAVQLFTNEKWRVQTQSSRAATFVSIEGIVWLRIIVGIILGILGSFLCVTFVGAIIGVPLVIIGVILLVSARPGTWRFLRGSQNLVVTVTPLKVGTDVTITYSKQANRLVERFTSILPK